ncbi:MAG: KEOPS complex subunit Pcc1 [Nitrososphaeria archaeon]|nr:KEOPS complex subunit Pcc1 [Nitrososphaeria archaeon]MDW8043354.1 KEOPS complex subunit Pcc1 [Nitrososphaerota archaeon]
MHPCRFSVTLRSPHARILCEALRPEVGPLPGGRSAADVGCSGEALRLEIESDDTVAMRAAANSFLRWISAMEKSLGEIEAFTRRE